MNSSTYIKRALLALTLVALCPVVSLGQIRPAENLSPEDEVPQVLLAGDTTDQVLSLLEMLSGRVILRPQNLPEMAFNFDSQGALTRAEAIKAIESILSMNGLAVVEMDDKFLRAVPVNAPVNALTPEFITDGSLPDDLNSQKLYAKIYSIQYVEMARAVQVIQQFRTQGLPEPVIFEQSSKLLITDSLNNLKLIDEVLLTADTPSARKEELVFVQLKNTQAREIAQRLQSLLTQSLQGFLVGQTVIEADERTNQIILLTHPANRALIDPMVANLDVNVSPLTSTRIFQANNARVSGGEEGEGAGLIAILNEIIAGQREARQRAENQRNANNRNNNSRQPTPNPQQEGPAQSPVIETSSGSNSDGAQNVQFSEYVGVVADERTNSVIAFGTESDLKQIEILMEQLDVLLPQVLIEVIITEVTLRENETRGIDTLGIDIDSVGGVWSLSNIATTGGGIGISDGNISDVSLGGTLSDFDLDLFIGSAAGNGNVRVLNAPQILTTHARTASIKVGQQRPFVTTAQSDTTGNSINNSVEFRNIGIELEVTPLIGSNGKIQLDIKQTVDNLVTTTNVGDIEQPVIGNRVAESYVNVHDGDVVILGGLQEYNFSDSQSRMALLGKIPILGDLIFTENKKEGDRRELILFIRPRILAESSEAAAFTEETLSRNPRFEKNVKHFLEHGLNADPAEQEPENASTFFNPRARAH